MTVVMMMIVLLLIACHLSIVHSFHTRYPSLYNKLLSITAYNNNHHHNNNNINNIIINNNFFRHHHHRSISSSISSSRRSDDLIHNSDNYSRVKFQKDLPKMILPVIISLLGYSLDFTSLLPLSSSSSSPTSSSSSSSAFHRSCLIANADDSNVGTKSDKSFELCISKCVFEETKPPPVGSSADRLEAKKSRSDIIKECRKKCAKTSEQLLIGSPKTKITKTNSADGQ